MGDLQGRLKALAGGDPLEPDPAELEHAVDEDAPRHLAVFVPPDREAVLAIFNISANISRSRSAPVGRLAERLFVRRHIGEQMADLKRLLESG